MKREDFIKTVTGLITEYIFERVDSKSNAQLRINPLTLSASIVSDADFLAEIADNEEAIEDAAAVDGLENEDGADRQAAQNPDFYPVASLIIKDSKGASIPDSIEINKLVDNYFNQ
ncbi:MAG: hypothetical protein NC201_07610 [Prevotella sp.]|nr:hypothetical protein [Bacteroides sp.]MCM1367094.1 hypothetical protein [Prevotella sp.]MCM1437359.1 hypothetical protein [Prevotella sp.]